MVKETKEDFCGLCVVAPLAFAGASATAVGGSVMKRHKKWRKMLLISGIASIILSILILIYYKKNCKECKL